MGFTHRKYEYEDIVEYLIVYELYLLTPKEYYKNITQSLDIQCKCGDTLKISFSKLKEKKNKMCKKCASKLQLAKSYYELQNYIKENTNLKLLTTVDNFKGSKYKIELLCACGTPFYVTANHLKRDKKYQCNECSLQIIRNKLAFRQEDVIKEINSSEEQCCYISGEYLNVASPLIIKCKCGECFETTFSQFKFSNKRQCNNCSNKNKGQYKVIDYSSVKRYIESKQCMLVTSESEYVNANNVLDIKCSCGEVFQDTYSLFKYKNRNCCSECIKKTSIANRTKSYIEVRSYIESNSSCILITKEYEYKNTHAKIILQCNCGDCFTTNFHEFKSGNKRQCNTCGNNHMKVEDFNNLARNLERLNNCVLLKYENNNGHVLADSSVEIQCECGDVFTTKRHRFTKQDKTKCNDCTKQKSKGETRIRNILKQLGINYIEQLSFEDCRGIKKPLPFDFAIKDIDGEIKFILEYDGKQHFEPVEHFGGTESFIKTINNDSIKNNYCAKNDIPLIRIPYWDYVDIDIIIMSTLSYFNLIKTNENLIEIKSYLIS